MIMKHPHHIYMEPSFVDLKQIAMCLGKGIIINENTFNGKKVYKIDGVEGLYTAEELKTRLLN